MKTQMKKKVSKPFLIKATPYPAQKLWKKNTKTKKTLKNKHFSKVRALLTAASDQKLKYNSFGM